MLLKTPSRLTLEIRASGGFVLYVLALRSFARSNREAERKSAGLNRVQNVKTFLFNKLESSEKNRHVDKATREIVAFSEKCCTVAG